MSGRRVRRAPAGPTFPAVCSRTPTAVGGMTREELDAELQKGFDSMQSGKVCTEEEVDAMLAQEIGI